ncbi:hypothetical protein VSX64_02395 [Aurantimonas sp. C2-6-R+9]|uniref:hypothetical protein n=1 Tax=unclassified Aurantimonas TaxID=2638230 RepID=UPI002E1904B4|nr:MULTISPECIES: hypothetical protein [unclassified Aurantimonas]MEC5289771.1 hypothetical protein [Aurantimonas sp. C2-3-R2]MEC5379738.1 hypothetical protein [Aurantimonas sp. C2-6-R+9]MEC5410790.1 hypothetical protein [Aurantimonas sp. C2-4-R8]
MAKSPPMSSDSASPTTQAAPARDGNIAIREEFDMAVEQGTAEAYDLFIKRHPDHPLTVEARRRLNIMNNGNANRSILGIILRGKEIKGSDREKQ